MARASRKRAVGPESGDQPSLPAPEPIGVIDIGSNQIRLVLAEAHEDGNLLILDRARLPAPLGRDTFTSGRISRLTMNHVVDLLKGHRRMLDAYGVEHIRTVATSSVREASNADAFCDRIFMATGFEVDILQPTEEALLMTLAVRQVAKSLIRRGYWLVIEVGGGSTLMTIQHNGRIIHSASSPLGAIRLMQQLGTSRERPERASQVLAGHVASVVSAMTKDMPLRKVRNVIALGSDARFIADQIGTPKARSDLSIAEKGPFQDLLAQCRTQTPDRIAGRYGLPFAVAETLVPAMIIHDAILRATAAKGILVSDVTIREGLLLDLAGWVRGKPEEEVAAGIVSSSEALARKYYVDMDHARHVTRLALGLFDALQDDHGLTARDRLLLHVASLLHEVGGLISARAHHKHSYYLLSNSELFGLQAYEQQIVANVARYHRGNMPRPTHEPYMAMRRDHRVIICKLAALLRVADALDRGHGQQVDNFVLRRDADEVTLQIPGASDLYLEQTALKKKGDLFASTFGLRIRLEGEG